MKAWKACSCALLALGQVLQGCGGDSARTKTMTSNKNKESIGSRGYDGAGSTCIRYDGHGRSGCGCRRSGYADESQRCF